MGDNGPLRKSPSPAMSEDQLSALLAKLKEDAGLREKLQSAGDIDAAMKIIKDAGFEVDEANLINHQAVNPAGLSDKELETVSGGVCFNSAASHWGDGGQCNSAFTCANTGLCDC